MIALISISWIVFLQTRNPSQEEAIELLVLSACETASGDKRAALGLAGMAVRAGARSTLATLWSVNDRATAKLMSDFYDELSNRHLTKANAVRQAQLSLLHTRGYEHPFLLGFLCIIRQLVITKSTHNIRACDRQS